MSFSNLVGYLTNSPYSVYLALGTSATVAISYLVNKIAQDALDHDYEDQDREDFEAWLLETLSKKENKVKEVFTETIDPPSDEVKEKTEKVLHQLRKNAKHKRRCHEHQFYIEL